MDYKEACCRLLYCIPMCKFAEGKNFKMTQNLYLHVFTEMGWEENVLLDDPIARQGLHEEEKKKKKKEKAFFTPP